MSQFNKEAPSFKDINAALRSRDLLVISFSFGARRWQQVEVSVLLSSVIQSSQLMFDLLSLIDR